MQIVLWQHDDVDVCMNTNTNIKFPSGIEGANQNRTSIIHDN